MGPESYTNKYEYAYTNNLQGQPITVEQVLKMKRELEQYNGGLQLCLDSYGNCYKFEICPEHLWSQQWTDFNVSVKRSYQKGKPHYLERQ